MGYITKYGSFWGMLPQTAGRIFWVAPADDYTVEGRSYSASDGNDGLSPERAFRTVDYGHNQMTASVGDILVLLPGAHTSTATVALDVAGVTIVGIPGGAHEHGSRSSSSGPLNKSSITNTGTAGIIFTVTAADVEVAYLDIEPTAAGGRGFSVTLAGARLYVHDCNIIMDGTASVTTYGIHYPDDVTGVNARPWIRNCYFASGTISTSGANGPAILFAGTVRGAIIENCTFELLGTAAWADAILNTGITNEMTVRDCDFITPTVTTTVMTDAIDCTLASTNGGTKVFRCYFMEGSDAFEATVTLDIVAAECYLANSTGSILAASA